MREYQIFKRRINYYETDQMQVVHHSNYIRFLEECRIDFMEQWGLSYAAMEEKGIMVPVLSVECQYLQPVRYGDTICIVPKVEVFRGVKFEVSYQIYSEDFSILHSTAKTAHCFLNKEFKPARLKKDFPEIWETMTELAQTDTKINR